MNEQVGCRRPVEAGWYWFRHNEDRPWSVVEVWQDAHGWWYSPERRRKHNEYSLENLEPTTEFVRIVPPRAQVSDWDDEPTDLDFGIAADCLRDCQFPEKVVEEVRKLKCYQAEFTRAEWISAVTDFLMDHGATFITPQRTREFAASLFQMFGDSHTPEEAAREDMGNW